MARAVTMRLRAARRRRRSAASDERDRSFWAPAFSFATGPVSKSGGPAKPGGARSFPRQPGETRRGSAGVRIYGLRAKLPVGFYRVRGWHCCHRPPLRTHRAIFTTVGSSLSNALFGGRDTATEAFCEISLSV